jgi:hypothetical protein
LRPAKRRAVLALLWAVGLWPALHVGLSFAVGLNPWKLAGWGMYAAPQIPATLRIVAHTPDEVGTYELRTLQPELQPVAERFLRSRLGLGRLIEPRELGAALLELYPAVDGFTIEVVQPVLRRGSAMIEERTWSYRYDRPGGISREAP